MLHFFCLLLTNFSSVKSALGLDFLFAGLSNIQLCGILYIVNVALDNIIFFDLFSTSYFRLIIGRGFLNNTF